MHCRFQRFGVFGQLHGHWRDWKQRQKLLTSHNQGLTEAIYHQSVILGRFSDVSKTTDITILTDIFYHKLALSRNFWTQLQDRNTFRMHADMFLVPMFRVVSKNKTLLPFRQIFKLIIQKRNFEDLLLRMSHLLFGGFLVRWFVISNLQVWKTLVNISY